MRAVAATTYQARLLGDALPDDATLLARAAADEVRGWLARPADRVAVAMVDAVVARGVS